MAKEMRKLVKGTSSVCAKRQICIEYSVTTFLPGGLLSRHSFLNVIVVGETDEMTQIVETTPDRLVWHV